MEFSEKLKTLQAEANLTKNELAEKLVISRQAISNYEQGRSYHSIFWWECANYLIQVWTIFCQAELESNT